MSRQHESVQPGAEFGCSADHWQRVWSHREHLLKVARRRSTTVEDAEDAVHEAMLRAAECATVDDERLGAWLTAVTTRLCVDRFRQLSREAEVHARAVLTTPGQAAVEERVCDRAEATWLAARSADLPTRQREVLALRAQGLGLPQIAERTGLSYQGARSALARARQTLRIVLAGTLALAGWLWNGRSRWAGGGGQTAALTSAAVTLAIASLTLTAPSEAQAEEQLRGRPCELPRAPHAPRAVEPDGSPVSPPPDPPRPLTAPGPDRERTADTRAGTPTTRPESPSAESSSGPSTPHDTGVPSLPRLPEAPSPVLPTVPDVTVPDVTAPADVINVLDDVVTTVRDSVRAVATDGPLTTDPALPGPS